MADIFISYHHENRDQANRIAGIMQQRGWTVQLDLDSEASRRQQSTAETSATLKNASCVLVLWSEKSRQSERINGVASEAARHGKLVPVLLDKIDLPGELNSIESASLMNWQGDSASPELEALLSTIDRIIQKQNPAESPNIQPPISGALSAKGYIIIAIVSFVIAALAVYYYIRNIQGKFGDQADSRMFYLILIVFGIAASALIFGVMNSFASLKNEKLNTKLTLTGPAVGVLLIVVGGFYLPKTADEKIITIRVYNMNRIPLEDGEVKLYLDKYIRTQSIDKVGQAQFAGVPAGLLNKPVKIEINSPGYATRHVDTLLHGEAPLELLLPFTTVVYISGKVKTAAEAPIKDAEISVDGTRYYAMSVTDGSYQLRLDEYTLGDAVSITSSHRDYEDKTIPLKIRSPQLTNIDFYLNPVAVRKPLP